MGFVGPAGRCVRILRRPLRGLTEPARRCVRKLRRLRPGLGLGSEKHSAFGILGLYSSTCLGILARLAGSLLYAECLQVTLTIHAQADHTMLSLARKVFGTKNDRE